MGTGGTKISGATHQQTCIEDIDNTKISATIYQQTYVGDLVHNTTYTTTEIFVPCPYNFIIVWRNQDGHNIFGDISRSIVPNLKYQNKFLDRTTEYYADNVKEIFVTKDFVDKCIQYLDVNDKRFTLITDINNIWSEFLLNEGKN